METHCLNIAWENVLRCLVKPKVAYLNTVHFSFFSYKHIQCHPFVCAECFKITLIEICRYLICHFVGLSYLCRFRVLQCQPAELSFSLVWQDCTECPIVRTSAQDPRGKRRKLMVGSKERPVEKGPCYWKTSFSQPAKDLNSPGVLHVCRGDVMLLARAPWALRTTGWLWTGFQIEGIKLLIELVSLMSRKTYPGKLSLEEDQSLFIISSFWSSKSSQSVTRIGLLSWLRVSVAGFLSDNQALNFWSLSLSLFMINLKTAFSASDWPYFYLPEVFILAISKSLPQVLFHSQDSVEGVLLQGTFSWPLPLG